MRSAYLIILILFLTSSARSASNDLPILGDATSGLISTDQEFVLGRTWLRNLRQQASVINDPILTEYTENLIYRLASKSEVQDKRLEVVLLDNSELNAFAVPGGVIGINAGLFLYAETESQFAAVLAHELAHLSQRHFARRVEESRKQAPIAMATLLGSILLLATNNTEAGFAGLMTSQAAATQWALNYSRDWESEADRLGMHTLVDAGFDPNGMPEMFEQMFNAHKYSERPPEFLLTHPVSENRVADAAARVDNMELGTYATDIEYQLMRTRIQAKYRRTSHNPAHYEKQLQQAKTENNKLIAKYGLAVSLEEQEKYDKAIIYADELAKQDKGRISFQVLHANILLALKQQKLALNDLKKQLALAPDNHPLTMAYAEQLLAAGFFADAATQLRRHVLIRATDPYIWQKLAESEGKLGNQIGLHQARAEFLFLTGYKKKALKQLEIALKLASDNYLIAARLQQRAREIAATSNSLDF